MPFLLIRHRPTWAAWGIPLLLLGNLALPARHVVWSFDIKMLNLRQAVALDRNPPSMFSAAGYVEEALVQAELGQRERAISFLDKAIALDSQYAPAYIHRAVLRSRNKDTAGAMEDARVGINLTPQAPEGYWVRGQLLAVESQWADALRDFEKVQSMITDSHPLHKQCNDAILKAQMKLNPQPAAP
ncbi:MAG: hypothetical protein HC898_10690 [Phycisphaerales bacterium]|nr:hypothetical protein [Phycisphaerales bacterium]